MFCTACGSSVTDRDQFCPRCGVAMKAMPMMPAPGRIAGHLRLLGIVWLAISAFRFAPALILLLMNDHGMFSGDGAPPFLSSLLEAIAVLLILLAMAGVIVGWGLLAKQPWARMAAIILGAANLIEMPFGTALGIYTLWVLLPVESEEQYQRLARLEPTRPV